MGCLQRRTARVRTQRFGHTQKLQSLLADLVDRNVIKTPPGIIAAGKAELAVTGPAWNGPEDDLGPRPSVHGSIDFFISRAINSHERDLQAISQMQKTAVIGYQQTRSGQYSGDSFHRL